jgi:hypothetical protein
LEQKLALLVNEKIQESLKECGIGGQLQDLRARETLYKKEIDNLRNELQGGKGHGMHRRSTGEDSQNL